MTKFNRLPGQLGEYFLIEAVLASTRSAQIFKALDRHQRRSIVLWKSRAPLSVLENEIQLFESKISQHARLPGVRDITSYGIDASGYGFIVFPPLDGTKLLTVNLERSERERRYFAVLRLVDRVHSIGVACEDLNDESFVIDRSGSVQFIGLLGNFEGDEDAGIEPLTLRALKYLAPEQHVSGKDSIQSDVFSLGVLGYSLFAEDTDSVPIDATKDDAIVSSKNPLSPSWSDEIIVKCLRAEPQDRFADAGAILTAITTWRENEELKALTPLVIKNDFRSRSETISAVAITLPPPGKENKVSTPIPKIRPSVLTNFKYIGVGAVVLILFAFSYSYYSHRAEENVRHQEIAIELPRDIAMGLNLKLGEGLDKGTIITKLSSSDDPIAHDVLLRELKIAEASDIRSFLMKAILERAQRLGLSRTSEAVQSWLQTKSPDFDVRSVDPILRLLDPHLPASERQSSLGVISAQEPILYQLLVASVALDRSFPEDFRKLFIDMLAQSQPPVEVQDQSSLACMLLVPSIGTRFFDDIAARGEQLSEKDLKWVLLELVRRNSTLTQRVADLLISRKYVESPRQIFLEALRRQKMLVSGVSIALVKGAIGKLTPEDMTAFSNWYDNDSVKVLAAIVYSSSDDVVRNVAFDALLIRPIPERQGAALAAFVRGGYKDRPTQVLRLFAMLVLQDILSDQQLSDSLENIAPLPKSRELLSLSLRSSSQRVISIILERYGGILQTGVFLDLLDHRDPEIKMKAIQHLSKANDVVALKLVLDAFEKEQDPVVQAAYKKFIPVIQERYAK